jgi:hypothetical protein
MSFLVWTLVKELVKEELNNHDEICYCEKKYDKTKINTEMEILLKPHVKYPSYASFRNGKKIYGI